VTRQIHLSSLIVMTPPIRRRLMGVAGHYWRLVVCKARTREDDNVSLKRRRSLARNQPPELQAPGPRPSGEATVCCSALKIFLRPARSPSDPLRISGFWIAQLPCLPGRGQTRSPLATGNVPPRSPAARSRPTSPGSPCAPGVPTASPGGSSDAFGPTAPDTEDPARDRQRSVASADNRG